MYVCAAKEGSNIIGIPSRMGFQYTLIFLEQGLIPVLYFKPTKALEQEGHCTSLRIGLFLEWGIIWSAL